MYKRLICIFLIFLAISCKKPNSYHEEITSKQTAIFSSKQEAIQKIQLFLEEKLPQEKLLDIQNISYIHTSTRTLAVVFYQTNTGAHNLVIERTSNHNLEMRGESITVCDGDNCACKVTAKIDNQGNVDIGCNCSSCMLITTEQ